MKRLITITIEGPSHNDIEQASRSIVNACSQTKDRINNGSSIKVSSCNPDDVNQLYSMMGRIKYWTLGKSFEENHIRKPVHRREEKSIDEIILGI